MFREPNAFRRVTLRSNAHQHFRHTANRFESKLREIEKRAERRTSDGDVNASGCLFPGDARELVLDDRLAHENSLEHQRWLDDGFDLARGAFDGCIVKGREISRVADRSCPEHAVFLDRLARFVDAYEMLGLPTHRASPFFVYIAHSSSVVIITGACEATKSSCPSREQMTPG